MREFWVSSGHHLTCRADDGGLAVTDELLLAYLARPELLPPGEACVAERNLHASLMERPRRPVTVEEIESLADADGRENWSLMIAFRERLLAARSIEAAYLEIVRSGTTGTPPVFLNHLVHLILRNALDGCDDPYVLRAGELLFRPQLVTVRDGAVLLADTEVVARHASGMSDSPLVTMLGFDMAAELDVLGEQNAWTYWSRSDAFSMVLNIGSDPKARHGLAEVVEAWIKHLLHIKVRVEPLAMIEEKEWNWFVGLDAEATRIGNALWHGEVLDEEARSRILALFRLSFLDVEEFENLKGPTYLLLATTPDKSVRVKPQNLIAGLPINATAKAFGGGANAG